MQLQYQYCHGIVFILDPLSIPAIRNYIDESVDERDRNSVGTIDSEMVLDAFMNKLREITGQSSTESSATPIAVVISKQDIRILNPFIGEDLIGEVLDTHGLNMDAYLDAEDAVCRKFLKENGLANFVSNIEMKFKNNRFFTCSAIGHVRENGKYNPKGVLEPIEWIFGLADPNVKSVWNEHRFGKKIEL